MSGTSPYLQPPTIGPSATVTLQQMNELVQALNNSVRALANIYTALGAAIGPNALSKPLQLAGYTVANLPAVTLTQVGSLSFTTNGRNTGEGGGAGTGCAVQVQNKAGTATWCAVWSGVAVTA